MAGDHFSLFAAPKTKEGYKLVHFLAWGTLQRKRENMITVTTGKDKDMTRTNIFPVRGFYLVVVRGCSFVFHPP